MFKKLILILSVLGFAQAQVSADESTGYINAIKNSKIVAQVGEHWNNFSAATSRTVSRGWNGTYAKDMRNSFSEFIRAWEDPKVRADIEFVRDIKIIYAGLFALVGTGLLLKSFNYPFSKKAKKEGRLSSFMSGVGGIACAIVAYKLGLDAKLLNAKLNF